MKTPQEIENVLERILPRVTKPGRYTGGEYNQVVKDWAEIDFKVALAFPDIYDLGMSNLGLMIMYDIINKHRNLLAERVYCPWEDMEAVMREPGDFGGMVLVCGALGLPAGANSSWRARFLRDFGQ